MEMTDACSIVRLKYDDFSDGELIQLYRSGDNIAFKKLVYRHKDRIFTSIIYRVKDHELAEDIFQEVFINIINAINSKGYKDNGLFLAWASRIAHNACISYFRKQNSRPKVLLVDAFSNLVELKNGQRSEVNIQETIIKRERYIEIESMLDKLPEAQRETLILRFYADMSFREIADLVGVSINTALGRARYALRNIRKYMEE
ncbi:RNA polymerase sigma factor [Chitinophaga polysaccharea]|uniref:RNA polymerase sigma factor n=1 Tax=Chitinophaga polysaccharea TaxID=1293035 RepID=UPI0021B01450|nr:sigma-70 family RNA polymerase sigma factor [Chitinophaga polysaccharea]